MLSSSPLINDKINWLCTIPPVLCCSTTSVPTIILGRLLQFDSTSITQHDGQISAPQLFHDLITFRYQEDLGEPPELHVFRGECHYSHAFHSPSSSDSSSDSSSAI
jgi:hypothetical protein